MLAVRSFLARTIVGGCWEGSGVTETVVPKLHDWQIEAREYARHESRRGRRHAYERLVPSRTAVVVVGRDSRLGGSGSVRIIGGE